MGKRFIIMPTAEEQQANFKDYQEKKARMDELQAEYERIKKSLKCSYCGDTHYIGGYCRSCYQYIRSYGTLERKYQERKENQKAICQTHNSVLSDNAVDKIYFELANLIYSNYDRNFDVPLNERENWLKHVFDMFPPNHAKTNECRGYNIALLRIDKGQTYKTIGQSYGLTKERVRQLIYSYIKSIKRRLHDYCDKQMREDGHVHF